MRPSWLPAERTRVALGVQLEAITEKRRLERRKNIACRPISRRTDAHPAHIQGRMATPRNEWAMERDY
jgi:hypothetical protein